MTTAFDEDQPSVCGDSHVAQLLKAELEGNREGLAALQRRGSCYVTSGGIGGLGIRGFEDPSSEDEYHTRRRNNSLPGSEDYRPLVGGFAAAAYEAAKDLHYRRKQRNTSIPEMEEDKLLPRPTFPYPSI